MSVQFWVQNGRNPDPTKDVRLVVNEDVSTHNCLVSGQNDLVQEIGAQVPLYPCVLKTYTGHYANEQQKNMKFCLSQLSRKDDLPFRMDSGRSV